MTTGARAGLLAIALLAPWLTCAAGGSTDGHAKPSSYAPREHAADHVYGTPIGPPIVGYRRPSHHVSGHKSPPARVSHANHASRKPPARRADPGAPARLADARPGDH